MPAHKKETPARFCEDCGAKLERKRLPNGDLEYLIHFARRKFCNQACMAASFSSRPPKSASWDANHYHARKAVPAGPCVRCGVADALDVHHSDGDHANNSRGNLERICRSCHMKAHRAARSCVVCGKPQKGLGYCELHYQRFKKHGDPLKVATKPKTTCRECGAPAQARGLCGRHYMRHKRATVFAD